MIILKNIYNKYLGELGEKISLNYLIKNKYIIIERNFKCKYGEIDIIAQKGNEIIFIEVKTRTSNKYGEPIEAVNYEKQKHILNSASYYIFINGLNDYEIRFDIIEVLKKDKIYIKHNINCEMLELV